jgi:hypothetical protein
MRQEPPILLRRSGREANVSRRLVGPEEVFARLDNGR